MAAGWMIAVMLTPEDEDAPARHYFAVGKPDQQRAEWAAVDLAVATGQVATSPVGGAEPVEALAALPAPVMRALGLGNGEARALGRRFPRRWIAAAAAQQAPGKAD